MTNNYDKLLEYIQTYYDKTEEEFDDIYYLNDKNNGAFVVTHTRGYYKDCGVDKDTFDITKILFFANPCVDPIELAEKHK